MGLMDLQQSHAQLQLINSQQIQSLKVLSLGTDDLHAAIYDEVEKNPALVIASDPQESGARLKIERRGIPDGTRTAAAGSAGELASDNFQAALEAHADERETLQEHLLRQLRSLRIPEVQRELCERLIKNLDPNGFHLLAPVSLLNRSDPLQTESALAEAMRLVQQLEPAGTCVSGVQESLLVQARQREHAPRLALLILDGHLDFLSPPQPAKIARRVQAFVEEQSQLFGQQNPDEYRTLELTEERAAEALAFIRTLDPHPARNFGAAYTHFISPDIYVRELPDGEDREDDWEAGIVSDGTKAWLVSEANDKIPQLALNPAFLQVKEEERRRLPAEKSKMLTTNLKNAQNFINMLQFRNATIVQVSSLIVKIQHEFFRKGPGHLVPLRQQDIATVLGVHETTVSRAANNKYLQCAWGLYEIKHFFTGALASTKDSGAQNEEAAPAAVSKDTVLHEIRAILEAHRGDGKKLSDQKLSDMLAERGIQVARRTVAKYRAQLNIESSYGRD